MSNRDKALLLAVIGSRPIADGVSIAAAHIDSPRLDLKPNPLYEDSRLAYFDTHYYGGIKKYQWTAIPLALHGVVIRRDGTSVQVRVGEEAGDPVFCVTDLLPHLGTEQMKRTAAEVVKGEDLNLLIGSRPFRDDEGSELVKLNVMRLLHEKYGITEADFLSAELEVVPAFGARDLGFDRSMIGAYGHDDRVCAYPALTALLALDKPAYTCCDGACRQGGDRLGREHRDAVGFPEILYRRSGGSLRRRGAACAAEFDLPVRRRQRRPSIRFIRM